ncbi:hypothetical protein VTO42DRAFT_3846 [Malbranchea cinnamomea]
MSRYSSDPRWSTIEPIPLDDGSNYYASDETGEQQPAVRPLATISYSEEYTEATAYLRAVMAENEMSERALELTEDVIKMNPAHYTVWLYRVKVVKALGKDFNEEIEWLNKLSLRHLKNYQIWHHRQLLMSDREAFPKLPPTEQDFLMQMFELDSKNYHVWTYRHWLVRHFGLWDSEREIQDVNKLIDQDVRNNSAWNHRFFLKFGSREDEAVGPTDEGANRGVAEVVDEEVVDAEIEYAKSKIVLAPENKSPWLYARGVLRAAGRPLSELKSFASKFVLHEVGDNGSENLLVKSSLAVEWLADVYAEEAQQRSGEAEKKERINEAAKMLTLLKDKYDPIRKNYWDYRIQQLQSDVAA